MSALQHEFSLSLPGVLARDTIGSQVDDSSVLLGQDGGGDKSSQDPPGRSVGGNYFLDSLVVQCNEVRPPLRHRVGDCIPQEPPHGVLRFGHVLFRGV